VCVCVWCVSVRVSVRVRVRVRACVCACHIPWIVGVQRWLRLSFACGSSTVCCESRVQGERLAPL